MANSITAELWDNFLGNSPGWYKKAIVGFLILNPIVFQINHGLAGWLLVGEFIFTLAMALRCYPLQPGGLLAVEAVVIGMTSAHTVYEETVTNFPVILLLIFMVAGIYFLRELLLFIFTKLVLGLKGKKPLSLVFLVVAAVLSAFLDALTVTAVVITVALGFHAVYHKVASGKHFHSDDHDHTADHDVGDNHRADLDQFRAFLRQLVMHAAVGTALGGVATQVGEPQNLLIAKKLDWNFIEFYLAVAYVSIPVLIAGMFVCWGVEHFRIAGYGATLPSNVRRVLEEYDAEETRKRTPSDVAVLWVQGATVLFLVIGLALHLAEVGLIGLTVIVLATAFTGVIQESRIGHAFEEALPFTALLVVFFAIVGVIHDQHLFEPVIEWVLHQPIDSQAPLFFIANGVLSMVSDNVFVATVYISEVEAAFKAGEISREHYETLAVAINTGTNIPSVATPNGQAAFLFLLTSALAPLLRLSYMKMVQLALPYTIVLSIVALIAVILG
ncbi:MAG: sodium/proton antiporter NhaB [Pseudomonadota bacterium]